MGYDWKDQTQHVSCRVRAWREKTARHLLASQLRQIACHNTDALTVSASHPADTVSLSVPPSSGSLLDDRASVPGVCSREES